MPIRCTETLPPITETRCVECPEITASEPRIGSEPIIGWNAGANSASMLDGSVHTVFTMSGQAAGVVVGFKGTRRFQTAPSTIEHGLQFMTVDGRPTYRVVERGAQKTQPAQYADGDVFEIRRVFGDVTYYRNSNLLRTSTTRSFGPLVVNACLYASGDRVP